VQPAECDRLRAAGRAGPEAEARARPSGRRSRPAARGGRCLDDVKSRAGRRTIALPPRLVALLTEHQTAQQRERDLAGDQWEDHGFVFTRPTGRPLDSRVDNREWAELLKEADVREARLHDARHTAATVLLVLGINQRAVMGLMGWSNNAMTTPTSTSPQT